MMCLVTASFATATTFCGQTYSELNGKDPLLPIHLH